MWAGPTYHDHFEATEGAWRCTVQSSLAFSSVEPRPSASPGTLLEMQACLRFSESDTLEVGASRPCVNQVLQVVLCAQI